MPRVSVMDRENISPLATATRVVLPVVPVRVVAPDVRIEVRRGESATPDVVVRLHRLDLESIPVMLDAMVARAAPFDAVPLDHDAGLRPVMTATFLANDAGRQAAEALAESLLSLTGAGDE